MDWSPVFISIKTASVSVLITFFLGIASAYWVFQRKSDHFKMIFDSIVTIPLVLPPTVAGFFLLYLFGINGPFGSLFFTVFGVRIIFSWAAAVLAAVVISFPLMYRSARGAFEQVDMQVIYAARTLGLCEMKIFWKIVMPLAMPGVVSGGILAFARGLGEFGATAMIAGNIKGRTRTLSLAIYSETAAGNIDKANRYVWVLLVVSFIMVLFMNRLSRNQKAGEK